MLLNRAVLAESCTHDITKGLERLTGEIRHVNPIANGSDELGFPKYRPRVDSSATSIRIIKN